MSSKVERYIDARLSQLVEDRSRASNEHDKNWYGRLIQELDWARQMATKPTRNCSLDAMEEQNV